MYSGNSTEDGSVYRVFVLRNGIFTAILQGICARTHQELKDIVVKYYRYDMKLIDVSDGIGWGS